MDLTGYELDKLRDEGDFALYRARQYDNPVSVLMLVAARSAPANLKRLSHEYALASELDPSWAARPLALSFQTDPATLVLEDNGGEPLDRILGQPLELTQFLLLAVDLAAVLGRVHRRGIIHKDIKPTNMLVDAAGRVRLTGFGIASRLTRERQAPTPPEVIAGTLAYMAPEQTGRMNRSIDARSDLYSLGVSLYEMLTGTLPFTASDPMEWVHCHIARLPVPPTDRVPNVPAQLSAIVMKLLAKTAEDRYQTAAGLEADLRRCLEEWKLHDCIKPFPLGAHEILDYLLVPEKLYGREVEIKALLAFFDQVAIQGATKFVLVSGYSGVGKSSLVNELHKALVPPRGIFAAGKFDQYKRDIPYATVAQAFQTLVQQILAKRDAEVSQWRRKLQEALRPNGQLIVNLIPELELIIGKQPPVVELSPQHAQSRFQMVFRRFIDVFARPEHPLALFLDDLQWLDAATLDLIKHLITHPQVQHLLLVGAYRDNEVSASHPLMRTLKEIRDVQARVERIVLEPLGQGDVGSLIAESLRCDRELARPLAQLVHEKTGGNPFFTIQFLTALADEALLAFDPDTAAWTWDLPRIRAKGFTDNVADLMATKLSRLPDAAQEALGQLACLGNVAEATTLTLVRGGSEEAIHAALWEAVKPGFVLRLTNGYTFAHDRIQEAAYALIAEEGRAPAHLRIGRLLASRATSEELEENIFNIVNQYDRGAVLISKQDERDWVAALNLLAGKRAKASTAYSAALTYLAAGDGLLSKDSWERCYHLAFGIELNRAECEYLTDNMASAEERLAMLSCRSKNLVDSAAVACMRLNLYTSLDRSDNAVEVGLEYLRRVGIQWSQHPTGDDVRTEYERLWRQLGSRSIEELIDLPQMTDPDWCATMDVLTALTPPALFTNENLFRLVVGRMANLTLEQGNNGASCLAYVWLGTVLGPEFGDYRAGFRFGQLGLNLVEKYESARFRARVYLVFGNLVAPWSQHLPACRAIVRGSFDVAQESGDLSFATYSCTALITNLLGAGDSLGDVQREAENGLEFAQKVRFGLVIDFITGQLRFIRTLRGLTPDFTSSNDAEFDESRFEQHLADDPRLAIAACWYWIRKLQARFLAGDYASAATAASKAVPLLWTSPSQFELAEYHFYAALTVASQSDLTSAEMRPQHLQALSLHHAHLARWAKNCPENFGDRAALVAAEIARIESLESNAMRLYEESIRLARAHNFVHNEAIANELAARFYAKGGFETIANTYLGHARHCYLRWGAEGKVRQLDQHYPQLRGYQTPPMPTATFGASIEQLDVGAMLKASQALSSEIVLETLIETLMRIAVEHAGAERGILILLQNNEPQIAAEANTGRGTVEVTLRQEPVSSGDLPESALHYVIRTRARVILDDASTSSLLSDDEYVRQRQPKSILCLPIMKQAKLVGALYLENNLTPRAFTPDRITVLEFLASQAAISLKNAYLYSDLQRNEAFLAEGQRMSHTGSWGWNVSTGKVSWSEEHYRILGYDRKDVPEPDFQTFLKRVHPEDRLPVQQSLEAAIRDSTGFAFDFRILLPDGSIRYLNGVGRPIIEESGQINDYVGTTMDVSARKQGEDALRDAQADLARAARLATMGELTTLIAHEVSQPLMAIVTNADTCLSWLTNDTPNVDEARQAAERVVRNGHRAGGIIRSIRALARKSEPEIAKFDINEAIGEILVLLRSELRRHNISLETELSDALDTVMGDRLQLQQVLLNLIMNGIEAMNTVTNRPRLLRVSSQLHPSGDVQVMVTDAGRGLDPDKKDRIFDAFFTTKLEGMGLGLAICRSIVEAHGGLLWASPHLPHGSAFHFTVPVRAKKKGADNAA